MKSSLSLNGTWKIRGFDGQHGQPESYCAENVDERTFIPASVPGEVHLDLERAGLIDDCNYGTNALSARWVEEQVWVYRARFFVPVEAVNQHAWLVFDGLDLNAVIYLNSTEIGRHSNAFTPCRIDVTGRLRNGENVLAVYVESGLYGVSDKPGAGYNSSMDHLLHKRAWQRKPQYSFSWDWNPRLVNVGIWKGVRLEYTDSARIDALTVYPELADDHRSAWVHVRAFIDNVKPELVKATIRVRVDGDAIVAESNVILPAGMSRQDLEVEIKNLKLWWPRTHGGQPLYDIECEIIIEGRVVDSAKRRTGIRSVRINQDPHPETGSYFIIEVNGRPIFAKGGNWVPPDMIYARPDAACYRKLAELAADANFNALRIWGGAHYADHALLDACDELGILVWHDFMFACSKYPGDDPDFLDDVRREVEFVTRDLSAHPSLLVWCGNNELELGAWDWGFDRVKSHPDYALYHMEIPRIVKREDPSRPYWPSSPYSPDHEHPNNQTVGDQHPWDVSLGSSGTDFWAYRDNISRFSNEGGVLGASSLASLMQFLPETERYLFSPSWEYHDNSCNFWQQVGICYREVTDWLGLNPEEMDIQDYAFYSALIQSEGLQEYIDNFRRRMFSSSSAIFWMYNDSLPVTHGWTIIDYYLRRKLAYHPVRRSFADIYVIPVVDGDKVRVYGVNDTLDEWRGEARYGIFKLRGGLPADKSVSAVLAPNASTLIGEFALSELHSIGAENAGAYDLLIKDGHVIAQNRKFIARFKDLDFTKPEISIARRAEKVVFSSPVFVWGVCIDINGESDIPDDVFDLLPGIEYEIDWPVDRPLPVVERCGSPIL